MPVAAIDSVVEFLQQYRQGRPASRPKVAAELTERIETEINGQIDSLVQYLQGEYRAAASDSARQGLLGLGGYPGGPQYYQYLMRRSTTLDVAPTDLFTYAVREVERISAAMSALRARRGFTGTDSAFRAMLRKDQRFVVQSHNDFETRVWEVIARLRDSVRSRLGIDLADSLVLVARDARVLDGSRRVNMRERDALDPRYRLEYVKDQATRLPAYVIPALVAREVVPGRLTLVSAINRNDSIPMLRQLMRFPGFVDGWSEHAGALVGELGQYANDYEAYGALVLELEASARMATDLGIHGFGWTLPNAVRYLRLHSVDASTADSDVLRIAVAEPARAIAAKRVVANSAVSERGCDASLGRGSTTGRFSARSCVSACSRCHC
ncbi:MAG: DUF885 family protein [Gemmatimonadaceae bacterium]